MLCTASHKHTDIHKQFGERWINVLSDQVVALGWDDPGHVRVPQHEVGIGANGNAALAGEQVKNLGGVCAGHCHKLVLVHLARHLFRTRWKKKLTLVVVVVVMGWLSLRKSVKGNLPHTCPRLGTSSPRCRWFPPGSERSCLCLWHAEKSDKCSGHCQSPAGRHYASGGQIENHTKHRRKQLIFLLYDWTYLLRKSMKKHKKYTIF